MTSPTAPPVIVVRPVETVAEYRACQEVQRRAWGITEDGYLVPVATMISVQHAGGLVLGAFDGGRVVGFAFAYLGRVNGRLALYSQLAGVDPAVQDRGIGGKLKAAQRDWARAQGLALVAWAFDPMQAGNANLNLHRLGATSTTYMVNYYGERTDALNAGLDTDRLVVEWPTDEAIRRWREDEPPVRIEIPADFAAVRAQSIERARDCQRAVRATFQRAFAAGYVAMDFVREAGEQPRAYYVLRRPAPEERIGP
jgi:predicted GNAT superfamily acetyltransferase